VDEHPARHYECGKGIGGGVNFTDLPAVNAVLNSLSAVFLMTGWVFIKRQNQSAHIKCMIAALITSTAFLTCYVYYHYKMKQVYGEAHTSFQDPAWFRPIYLAILFTHLIGAFAIVPLVIMTVTWAIRRRFESHKKVSRWTWPLWMYVSVTGVLIYLLLYQIFPQRTIL
jgi:putative membrane protein